MNASTRPLPLIALAAALAVASCATRPRAVEIDTPVRLVRDSPVQLPDRSTLAYAGLRDDSRCPPTVLCIHAGSVTLDFRHMPANAPARMVTLHAPRTTTADLGNAWRLVLADPAAIEAASVVVRIQPIR